MKTLRLDINYEYDFDLYGLVSVSKDYSMAWWLNKLFNIHLTKQQDLCYIFESKDQLLISNYEFSLEHLTVRLLKNRALGITTLKRPFLLPDIKEYDYVLQISGALSDFYSQEFISKLNKIPIVQYVKQFDPSSLKFKENLIF
jgi:hypothetical protein